MSISGKLPQAGCNAIKKRLLLQTRLLCDVQNIGKNKKRLLLQTLDWRHLLDSNQRPCG